MELLKWLLASDQRYAASRLSIGDIKARENVRTANVIKMTRMIAKRKGTAHDCIMT